MNRHPAHAGFSWGSTPAQRAYRQSAPALIAPQQRRPFSKPKAELRPGSGSPLKTAQIIPFSSTLKPEAVDTLPPMEARRMISRPEPTMSDAAKRLFMLKWWLEECYRDRNLDADAYTTECRLREQAAHIIGYFA